MDNLYIPLILRNSDKQAGGLTELRFNNLYSYNRKERDLQRDNQSSVLALIKGSDLTQELKKI